MKKNEKGFVLVFIMAVIAALSIMTSAMYFYYDNDLKSVSRNSVMQQVTLAAETGLQEGQRWVANQLNSNTFSLVDIQNTFHIDDSNNACLNRHGFNNQSEDVYYAKRIQENLGADYVKFEDVSYEVFIQRQADVVRSIYFSEQGSKNNQGRDTIYIDRSFALVENFKDFPTEQFTIEMWIKNKQPTSTYNMHLFEWGREWDLVFKVKNDEWSPRLGEVVLDDQSDVGTPVKDEWVHVAWVWDGGDPDIADQNNVKIYQNGVLSGTFNANISSRKKAAYENPPEILPEGNYWPLAIGEGLHGFSPNNYLTGKAKIQSTPWLGNISEMRIWNVSRSATDISNNRRKRLTGSEPGLVSYYKFNEGTGSIAKDYNTSRNADDLNDATIYGLGTVGTLWETEIINYPVTSTNDNAPSINVPPGEDLVYYKILSCGNGPQGQIIPLELVVSAPVQKGDVGDGNFVLTPQDLNTLSGQEGTPLMVSLSDYVGNFDVAGDIAIQETNITNTDFFVFKRSMEQCNNSTTFTEFNNATVYNEEDCAEFNDKLWMLEKDAGTVSGDEFTEEEWSEVLGSDCDGVQFKSTSGDASYGHYYKYFSTAPNLTSDLGYNRDSIDWWEAKRRAEQSTCGGMRGYLVSIETAAENEFIKDAVMCDNSTASGCTGVIPFHVAAGETRANYYGSRLDGSNDQHYLWLANSDWREPLTMRSESGPDMGATLSFTSWQSGEPNGGSGAEDYTDMEINRSGRTNGGWNDLHRIPNCNSNGLDCITGYVVEYGGFDSFKLDHDENRDGDKLDAKDLSENTKTCVARATIEKDKYVSEEDYLKYDNTSDTILDGSTDVTVAGEPFDSDLSDDYPGWDVDNGVLTLFHSEKPVDWNPNTSYSNDSFTWFNNRVWKNISGGSITGGSSLAISQTPTIYNPTIWQLYSGNESDAPCGNLNFWQQAFESIKYFNTLAVDPTSGTNPYNEAEPSDPDAEPEDMAEEDEDTNEASLGERVIIFSLGPLHVNKHRDGYNHFYEFYQFPARASGTQNLYNNKNRRMNEAFSLSRQLAYFGKTGYLATVTSEIENDIITEKAIGNGWMGGLAGSSNQNSDANLNKCGGFRQRDNVAQSTSDFRALKDFENITMYRGGQSYGSNVNYLRNIVEKYSVTSSKTIASISKANPAVITTSSNHGLEDDDIVKIADIDSNNQMNVDGMTQLDTGFYRVRVVSNNTFSLVDLDTRENINSAAFSSYTASSAQLWELEGIQNEFYRKETTNINNVNNNPQSQSGIELFYKDPKIAKSNSQPITGNKTKLFFNASLSSVSDTVSDTECPVWRWMTGPESMIWNGRGLAFAPTRKASNSPSANNGTWTRSNPSGQQIGEVFKDGMPFRNWNGTGEPNNVAGTEHGIHLLGTHFPSNSELTWNDLHNWNASYSDNLNYSIRGLIVEYGGLESAGDPITRIAAKRIINLFDRRVTKATVTISNGLQSGDILTAADDISDLGLTVTGDDTGAITFTGVATCKNYLDAIKGITFEHTGATEGIRQISVAIGDVKKPTGSDHYFKKVDGSNVSYQQADYQASYSNLCGLQGYLANVTTAADLAAISTLGLTTGSEAWINGTDECQGGIFRSGFWRYSSGPWKDKEFWRLRINSSADIDSVSACNESNVRSSQPSVRVGPFETANWISNHPAANNNDYLTYQHSSNPGIKTRLSTSSSEVEAYIVRYGGSVGDFAEADIDEVNDINVLAGPLRAEISFYTDSSDNSIFINNEDTLEVPTTGDGALSSGWSKTQAYSSQVLPLQITPPATELITMEDWRRELAKVYYKNINLSNFTPGNRKIKITLVYGDASLNQTIGILKTIGSKNKVTVTPISWSNR